MSTDGLVEEADEKCFRVQITEQELLCKNHCGFYGTPQCNGLCSQCWRAYQQGEKYAKNRVLLRQESMDERRKTSEARGPSIKSLFPRSPSLFNSSDPPPPSPCASNSSFGLRLLGADSPGAQQQFLKYITDTFTPSVAKDVEKHCLNFMDRLSKYWILSRDDDAQRDDALSEMIQSMYRLMTERISQLKSGSTSECFKVLDFMIQLESYICDHAYPALFCTRTEEESADLSLQERIRSLHWVTSGFLETSLDFSSDKVQYFLDEAVTQIVDLNSHRTVSRKLECLINCSKNIFDALKESRSGAPASADEFLPVLIYAILKANPPLIQSNLNFISRYALPYRIMRGESGYYFTNLCCAIQFIQNMNAESLHLTPQEFDEYTNGKRVPPKRSSISNTTMKFIDSSMKRVEGLSESRDLLIDKADKLEEQITNDCENFKKSVLEFLSETDSEKLKPIRLKLKETACEEDFLKGIDLKLDQLEMSAPSSSKGLLTSSKMMQNQTYAVSSTHGSNEKKKLADKFVDAPLEICVMDCDNINNNFALSGRASSLSTSSKSTSPIEKSTNSI